MKVSEFDFDLPQGLIATAGGAARCGRLLVVDSGLEDRWVRDLPGLLRPGDLLVVNDTRVIRRPVGRRRGGRRGSN